MPNFEREVLDKLDSLASALTAMSGDLGSVKTLLAQLEATVGQDMAEVESSVLALGTQEKKCCQDIEADLCLILSSLGIHWEIRLFDPTTQKESDPMKFLKMIVGPGKKATAQSPLSMTDIAAEGATIVVTDGAGNALPGGLDPTKVSVAWSVSDATFAVLSPDTSTPPNPLATAIKSTGKLGTFNLVAVVTNLDGTPNNIGTLTAPVTVTVSAPQSGVIALSGTPVP
jgi:hypothetical protein